MVKYVCDRCGAEVAPDERSAVEIDGGHSGRYDLCYDCYHSMSLWMTDPKRNLTMEASAA